MHDYDDERDSQMRSQARRNNDISNTGLKKRDLYQSRFTDESRFDGGSGYPGNLMLQKNSFMVCQRACNIQECNYISFSQKRFIGFRDLYEFEKKRVMVASSNQI